METTPHPAGRYISIYRFIVLFGKYQISICDALGNNMLYGTSCPHFTFTNGDFHETIGVGRES